MFNSRATFSLLVVLMAGFPSADFPHDAKAEIVFGVRPIANEPPPYSPQYAFGLVAVSIHDLDGDGFQEIAIKSTRVGSPGRDIWVVSGATGIFRYGIASPAGATQSLSFGNAMSSVPDVDYDMIDDLIVSAPAEQISGGGIGRVYLYSAATGTLLRQFQSPATQGGFGTAVAGCPDLDGDGAGDVIIGAPEEHAPIPGSGRVYVFSGASGTVIRTFTSPNAESLGKFGTAVAVLHQTIGPPDIVVGAPRENTTGFTDAGRIHLFDLTTGTYRYSVVSPTPVGTGNFGSLIAIMPDKDHDELGKEELVVVGPREGGLSVALGGAVHVLSGATGSLYFTLHSPVPQVGDFGRSIACRSDLDGDGIADIIAGAPKEDHQFADLGAIYIFSGSTGALTRSYVPPPPNPGNVTYLFGSAITTQGFYSSYGSFAVTAAVETSSSMNRFFYFVNGDCNSNFQSDALEIELGTATDCNENSILDSCEMEYFADCNTNGASDYCDIETEGASDQNEDGIPDECLNDCFSGQDCNQNQIPDSDELVGNDCNVDGTIDTCQIALPYMSRVSENASGEPANTTDGNAGTSAYGPAMSTDGRIIAFLSSASNLVPGAGNGYSHVYVKDMNTQEYEVIDRNPDGSVSDANSGYCVDLSADGNVVAFVSEGSLLGPTNAAQVYVFNRVTQQLQLVSKSLTGSAGNAQSYSPVVSANGRYVAFVSEASDLFDGDINLRSDVLRFDCETGVVQLISRGFRGDPGNGDSATYLSSTNFVTSPRLISISENGRYVAFESSATNLVPTVHLGIRAAYVHDCVEGISQIVSINHLGQPQWIGITSGGTLLPFPQVDISLDGRFVAFGSSQNNNLVPNDPNGPLPDLFVRDRALGTTRRLEINGIGTNRFVGYPRFSGNGCFVTFRSGIPGLVPEQDPNQSPTHILTYRYDLRDDSIQLVTRNVIGESANSSSAPSTPSSFDGNWVLNSSYATNLTNDEPGSPTTQLYLRYMPGKTDCNINGIPDDCEIAGNDCDQNGVFDLCGCHCFGDINRDALLDARDVEVFVGCVLNACVSVGCACADIDVNGITDLGDVAAFVTLILESSSAACPE